MLDIYLIISLIWLFYVIECIVWGKKDVAYFRSVGGHKWRIIRPSELMSSVSAGVLLRFPFPPLGILSPALLPQIAFSTEGMSNYVSENDALIDDHKIGYYLYEEIEVVSTRDREILVNGRVFSRAPSRDGAIALGEFIKKVKKSRTSDREKLIAGQIANLLRESEIRPRIDEFREKTSALLILCNFLWIYLILGIPALLFIYGFSRLLLPFIAIVIVLHFVIAGLTWRAYREIYGRRRYSLLYTLLPSPFNSIRAMDLLSKELLSGHHPFAVARSLLPRKSFVLYAKKSLAKIRYPLYDTSVPEESMRIDRWYKSRLIASMEKAINAMGFDMGSFLTPEGKDKEGFSLSFCPRCLGLYQKEDGFCADCPGVKLIPHHPGRQ